MRPNPLLCPLYRDLVLLFELNILLPLCVLCVLTPLLSSAIAGEWRQELLNLCAELMHGLPFQLSEHVSHPSPLLVAPSFWMASAAVL